MYRDDLHAAHKRIEELEANLAQRPKPKRGGRLGLGLVLIACVAAATGVLVRNEGCATVHEPPVLTAAPAVLPLPPLAHDYQDVFLTPFTPDVDGDGVEDVVGKFRNMAWADNAMGPVYVSAVSGKTFAPLWIAGPYMDAEPSNVAVVGKRVVVKAQDQVVILDLATGEELRRTTLTGTPSVCPVRSRADVALLGSDDVLDVNTGVISKRDVPMQCDYPMSPCSMTPNAPCIADGRENSGVAVRNAKVHGWTTMVDGQRRVSFGWVLVPSLARDHMYAAGSTTTRSDALWEEPATLEGEPVSEIEHVTNYQGMMADLHGDRFVLAYMVPGGGVRVVGRSARSGALLWNVLLGGRPQNAALRATATRLYVVADWNVYVLDGESGKLLGVVGDQQRRKGE